MTTVRPVTTAKPWPWHVRMWRVWVEEKQVSYRTVAGWRAVLRRHQFSFYEYYFLKHLPDRDVYVYFTWPDLSYVYHCFRSGKTDLSISRFTTAKELELAIVFESLRPLN